MGSLANSPLQQSAAKASRCRFGRIGDLAWTRVAYGGYPDSWLTRSTIAPPWHTDDENVTLNFEIRIPDRWQFGRMDAMQARQGGIRRAIFLAIQRHIFDSLPEAENVRDAALKSQPAQRFADAVTAFSTEFKRFSARQSGAAALLRRLAGNETGTSGPVPAEGATCSDAPPQDPATAAFCLTLHGLCWCLAAGRLGDVTARSPAFAAENEEDDGEDDDDIGLMNVQLPGAWLGVEFAQAVAALAELLQRVVPQKTGEAGAAMGFNRDEARLVAKGLLKCLLKVMPEMFLLEQQRLDMDGEKPLTRQRIVARSPDLARRIEGLLRDLPYTFTVQPLRTPARYLGGEDVDLREESCFLIPLIGYRRTNGFLGRFLGAALKRPASEFAYPEYVEAVDRQQAVPWRINTALLEQARRLAALAHPKRRWTEDVRAAVADLDKDAMKQWRVEITEKFYRSEEDRRKIDPRPGEFLDSLLATAALADLTRPGAEGAPPAFYLPWKADYRGRIYAETPWLSPQGADLQRALFEFARGRSLDEAGVSALRRHGANLVGRERMLQDLGINGRQVLTLEERERWVTIHETDICRSAEAPLVHRFWWEVASKPMQFLAFCLAYRHWKTEPDRPVHLPVQIDGTCNGLQHIAALTGDVRLAQAVNVLPREDGLPADIYSEVARAARATVGDISALLRGGQNRRPEVWRMTMIAIDALLAERQDWLDWLLGRTTAKAVVMTVPYGASTSSQAQNVLRAIERELLKRIEPDDAIWSEVSAWADAVYAEKEAARIVWRCARGRLKSLGRPRDAKGRHRLRMLRVFGSGLAWVIAMHVRGALRREFPGTSRFASWLGDLASCCGGLPLMWLTPLGLPVCQDKFRQTDSTLSGRIGRTIVSIGITRLEETVSEREQRQALLPNLIHSLDATHLAMTLNSAAKCGISDIGSIHDCLLCHPNDAEKLGTVVRRTFAALYRPASGRLARPQVLENWVQWMQFVARLAALPDPHLVLGSLDMPGGLGEQWLQQAASKRQDDAATRDAAYALDVLKDVRALDRPHRALARVLLTYARDVPIRPDAPEQDGTQGGPSRKRHPLDTTWPELAGSSQLPLGKAVSSAYFFS